MAPLLQNITRHIKPRQWTNNIAASLKPQTEAEKVYMLGSLIYVPSAILTPIVTQQQLRSKGIPQRERHLLVSQEWIRQGVGAAVHFLSFFGGIAAFGLATVSDKGRSAEKYLKQKANKAIQPETLKKIFGSVLFATVGNAWLRPTILNNYVAHWFKQDQQKNGTFLPKGTSFNRPKTMPFQVGITPYSSTGRILPKSLNAIYPPPPSFSKKTTQKPQKPLKQPHHFATPQHFTPFFR